MNQTKKCKHCQSEIDKKAKICPNCRKKQGGKLKFIIIAILVIGALGSALGSGGDSDKSDTASKSTVENTGNSTESNKKDNSTATTEEGTTATTENEMTMGQRNALSKAGDYLAISGFSRSGLIEQLEFEGFSTDEATYAVDNCGADWNEQAAKKAQEYLNVSSFSRTGLIEQLEFEGFTAKQAEYGVSAVGY